MANYHIQLVEELVNPASLVLLLGKAHIGEVQASIWPEDMIKISVKKTTIQISISLRESINAETITN